MHVSRDNVELHLHWFAYEHISTGICVDVGTAAVASVCLFLFACFHDKMTVALLV